MKDYKSHWDRVYERNQIQELGWYEDYPEPSLRLLEKCVLDKKSLILNVGAGASTFIDELVKFGYLNIFVNDISINAIDKLKNRLGSESKKVSWIIDDISDSKKIIELGKIDLWHDRAVLHFFTEEKDRKYYFGLIDRLINKGGYVIIAVFNLHSAEMCSGLPVYRYDENMISKNLPDDFILIDSFDYTYRMPSGNTREYIYTLYKRI